MDTKFSVFSCLEKTMLATDSHATPHPLFLGSHGDFEEKVLFHKRPHCIVDDDHLWSLCRRLPLHLFSQSQDPVTDGPVTGGAAWHHSNLPVLEALDDVHHQVHVFFGNNDHNALDPRHPARTRRSFSNVCFVTGDVREENQNITMTEAPLALGFLFLFS